MPLEDWMAAIIDYRGKTPEKTSSGIPLVTAKIVKGGRIEDPEEFIAEDAYEQWMRRGIPEAGDVVLTTEAPLGEVAQLDGRKVALAQRIITLRGKPGLLDNTYLKFALQSQRIQEQLHGRASGSTVTGIKQSELRKLQLTFPSIEEQQRVARILGSLDDKIEINRRINQTLEAMAQAIFKSWFVDFDPVKAKIAAIAEGRDPQRAAMSAISGKPETELDAMPPEQYAQLAVTAALFPDEMEASELGDIPRGWSVSKVETLLSRLSAKARYTKEQVSEYGQIPVFEQGASILLGYHNGVAYYPASAESPMFIFGDHTCVTRLSCQPFDISQNVIPLQGKDRATAWVYYAIKEKQKFQEYRRHWMELISKDVVVAAADICLEFSKRISKLHLQIEANERQMQSLRELRDTLLPKLLSGKLSVTETIVENEA